MGLGRIIMRPDFCWVLPAGNPEIVHSATPTAALTQSGGKASHACPAPHSCVREG
jgi:hypothetical protein